MGIHALLKLLPPGSCFHGVVQLRHQTESQVAREVAGSSRMGGADPWLTHGPRAGHCPRRGVPLREHRPRDGSLLYGLGAPVPSRALAPARRAGSGLADSRWARKIRYSWVRWPPCCPLRAQVPKPPHRSAGAANRLSLWFSGPRKAGDFIAHWNSMVYPTERIPLHLVGDTGVEDEVSSQAHPAAPGRCSTPCAGRGRAISQAWRMMMSQR